MRTETRGIASTIARKAIAAYSYLRFAGKKNLRRQIDRHVAHWHLDNAIAISHALIPQMVAAGLQHDARILVVGCCNMLEIYAFLGYGFRRIRGIDLVSHNPRYIQVMDMHEMSFPAASFDAIYCAGAIQCTHNAPKLAREFARVLKPGGMIAISVPVDFPPSDVYPYDARNAETLHQTFGARPQRVLWSEVLPALAPTNPNSNVTVRTIFRLNSER